MTDTLTTDSDLEYLTSLKSATSGTITAIVSAGLSKLVSGTTKLTTGSADAINLTVQGTLGANDINNFNSLAANQVHLSLRQLIPPLPH